MSEHAAVLTALEGLERIRNRINALPRDNVQGWKQQYIAMRRELQTGFAAFSKAVDTWLASGGDGIDARRLRELAGAYRSRLAEHQARFPVVAIDPGDGDYWASMQSVDVARRDLAAFVRAFTRR